MCGITIPVSQVQVLPGEFDSVPGIPKALQKYVSL